ncbi:MAG: Subtilase family protein [Caulobacteraceae bacterium]|nr:Subtilase family protein [Caulobacteraceae bacterium]
MTLRELSVQFWSPAAPAGVLSVQRRLVSAGRDEGRGGLASAHDLTPLSQGGRASFFVQVSADEVALLIEVVADSAVDGGEFLERLHPPKPLHGPLSSSEGLVGILSPVVDPAADLLTIDIADLIHRRAIGAEAVGDDRLGSTVALFIARLMKESAAAVPPKPHGLVADVDPALEQQILDVAQKTAGV